MDTERFFHPLHEPIDRIGSCYDDSKHVLFLDCLGRMSNDAFYIIDYVRWTFLHVVSGGLFLAGRTAEQVRDDGFGHYERAIHQDDLRMLEKVNKLAFNFFYSAPLEQRLIISFSYDFRVKDRRGNWVLVNQRLVPLELTPNGTIRLAMCKVSVPTSSKPGNAMITLAGQSRGYRFSEARQAFVTEGKQILSETAIQVITLSGQGMSEVEVADYLGLGIYTIKYHKKTIFKKLKVKNIQGAIQWLNNHKVVHGKF